MKEPMWLKINKMIDTTYERGYDFNYRKLDDVFFIYYLDQEFEGTTLLEALEIAIEFYEREGN